MYVCGCVHVYLCVCMCVYVCMWLRVTTFRDRSCDLNSVTGDPDSCSLWIRYNGNSKTDPWDDPEIHTGPCSEDQMKIRIQNRVISCVCFLFISVLFHVSAFNLFQ